MKKILVAFTLLISFQLYSQKAQTIPGKVECELYNTGGEGVAYHDTDPVNNGSGKLNPANGTFLNEFRMKEGVDISYTKEKNIDNTQYNKVQPKMNQLYVGWTAPGEWVKYDVEVKKDAGYIVSVMYTANGDGKIALEVDGQEKLISKIKSTDDPRDTVAWRQWHHWDHTTLGNIDLKKGKHVITLKIIDHGNMNFDFLEFSNK